MHIPAAEGSQVPVFHQVLADELETAIKELSSCLLYPDGPITELDACVSRFEARRTGF